MFTRCPACTTTFRVTPEQLKARLGRVRCGQCNTVFNSLDGLVEETLAPPTEPNDTAARGIELPAETIPVNGEATVAGIEADAGEMAEQGMETAEQAAHAVDDRHPELIDVEDIELALPEPPTESPAELAAIDPLPAATEAPQAESDLKEMAADVADTDQETITPLAFEAVLHQPPRARRWPWLIGALFALLALVAQAVMYFRTELSVLQPGLRPVLLEACAAFGCNVPLPQKVDQLGIEASDLQPAGHGKGLLQLTATLHNRAPFAQEYPLLELTLTDVADKPLIVKSLQPADYLSQPSAASSGFAADGALSISLLLDVGETPAVGYRLYLYYP